MSPGYFQTLGTPLLAGRDFGDRDRKNSTLVAVINETLAKKFFRGVNPIGKFYREEEGTGKTALTQVVGVVKDAKYRDLREATLPTAYVPMSQDNDPWGSSIFEIRAVGPATA